MPDKQWGFLSGRSTTSALLSVTHDWMTRLDKGSDHDSLVHVVEISINYHEFERSLLSDSSTDCIDRVSNTIPHATNTPTNVHIIILILHLSVCDVRVGGHGKPFDPS